MYFVKNVCFFVVVFIQKGGGVLQEVFYLVIRFCFVCLSLRKKYFYFQKNNFRMYLISLLKEVYFMLKNIIF